MAENLKHSISQIELSPPEGSWDRIAQRLDLEFDQSESRVSELFSNLSLNPPQNAWENIASAIQSNTSAPATIKTVHKEETKVVPLFQRKWMSAAVTTGLVLLAATFYLLNQKKPISPTEPASKENIASNNRTVPETSVAADAIGPLAGLIPQMVTPEKTGESALIKNPIQKEDTTAIEEIPLTEPDLKAVATIDIEPVKPKADFKVSAPAIRDKKGNIILDMDLLTSPSTNYISVTGPNGEQTRVSSKFAQYLAYMNDDSEEQDDYIDFLFKQSGVWRHRFAEWKNKFAEQTAFAPSGAFFFDILELKELIKE